MEFSIGACCFGLVIGWITYRTLRRQKDGAAISDIATVIGAVGGGAVMAIWVGDQFESYSIGLAVGFFAYYLVGLVTNKGDADSWMMGKD